MVSKEHGESVKIVACANALGNVIPPMILYKEKRMKPEWVDILPPESVYAMTPKGSMITATFLYWLDHFSRFKCKGRCLLIFDGVKSHLDYSIIAEAEKHDIVLFCLPSNTTHKLQPLDKSCFRLFEHYWDQELLLFHNQTNNDDITKARFGRIFSPVWDRTLVNVRGGFRATGIYPFDPNAIPDEASAPSFVTFLLDNINNKEPQPSTSGLSRPSVKQCSTRVQRGRQTKPSSSESDDTSSDDNNMTIMIVKFMSHLFAEVIPTPKKVRKTTRIIKPALNSGAVLLKKELFLKTPNPKMVGVKPQ